MAIPRPNMTYRKEFALSRVPAAAASAAVVRRATRIIVVSGLLFCGTVLGQSVEFKLDSQVLEVGETVNAQLICLNTGEPTLPEFTVPPGLELKVAGGPNVSQSMQIINGRRSQTVQYTYTLRVTARTEGKYRLGPFLITDGKQSYSTNAVEITVRKSAAGAGSNGDKLLWVELSVQPETVYVTQSYQAMLTIGIRKVEIGGRVYDFDSLLRKVLDGGASDLSVFANGRYTLSDVSLADSAGKRNGYEVYRVVQDIRAESVGEASIGPVFLRVNYPTSLQRGFFGDLEIGASRKETARAEAVKVTVKGPPQQGRPADFSGAIGQYTLTVSAKPLRVEQGQPVTLSVAIKGTPLTGVAGPNLAAQAELVSRFDFTNDELVADSEEGAKVFRRAIFPKTPGEQTIPPLRWSYFNPQTEQYVTLFSEPLAIIVDPSSGQTPSLAATPNGQAPEASTLTLLSGGISPNYADLDSLLAQQSFGFNGFQAGVLGAAPLACLVITWLGRVRNRSRSDVAWARRRRAKSVAAKRAAAALQLKAPHLQWEALAAAWTGYLADRYDLSAASLTPLDVRQLLAAHQANPAMIEESVGFLEQCDASRYAPGLLNTQSPVQVAERLRSWIEVLERAGA